MFMPSLSPPSSQSRGGLAQVPPEGGPCGASARTEALLWEAAHGFIWSGKGREGDNPVRSSPEDATMKGQETGHETFPPRYPGATRKAPGGSRAGLDSTGGRRTQQVPASGMATLSFSWLQAMRNVGDPVFQAQVCPEPLLSTFVPEEMPLHLADHPSGLLSDRLILVQCSHPGVVCPPQGSWPAPRGTPMTPCMENQARTPPSWSSHP